MTHDGPDNTVLPSRTWLGAFVRVRDEAGDEWHAAVVGARVGVRSRRLRKVVLRWGAGEARRDYRRRVLRVERVLRHHRDHFAPRGGRSGRSVAACSWSTASGGAHTSHHHAPHRSASGLRFVAVAPQKSHTSVSARQRKRSASVNRVTSARRASPSLAGT